MNICLKKLSPVADFLLLCSYVLPSFICSFKLLSKKFSPAGNFLFLFSYFWRSIIIIWNIYFKKFAYGALLSFNILFIITFPFYFFYLFLSGLLFTYLLSLLFPCFCDFSLFYPRFFHFLSLFLIVNLFDFFVLFFISCGFTDKINLSCVKTFF